MCLIRAILSNLIPFRGSRWKPPNRQQHHSRRHQCKQTWRKICMFDDRQATTTTATTAPATKTKTFHFVIDDTRMMRIFHILHTFAHSHIRTFAYPHIRRCSSNMRNMRSDKSDGFAQFIKTIMRLCFGVSSASAKSVYWH